MIVVSLILVIVAAVLLVLAVFQEGLLLIYLSIVACLLALVALGVGVALRRRGPISARDSRAGPPVEQTSPTRSAPAGGPGTRLRSVDGLGTAEREALLQRFGSEQGVRDASIEELTQVRGVDPDLARAVKDALR